MDGNTLEARAALDRDLHAAHRERDGGALAALYARAADLAGDVAAERFYLVQAYVFALENGLALSTMLKRRLVALGAEEDHNDG